MRDRICSSKSAEMLPEAMSGRAGRVWGIVVLSMGNELYYTSAERLIASRQNTARAVGHARTGQPRRACARVHRHGSCLRS